METYQIIMGVEAVVLFLLSVAGIYLLRKRKEAKQLATLGKEKIRESELDSALINPAAAKNNKKAKHSANFAYDVKYHEEAGLDKRTSIAVQLVVETSLSTKKHLLQIKDRIQIGSGKENDVVVNDMRIANVQCVLINNKQRIFLKNMEEGISAQIKRRGKRYEVGNNPPELRSGDEVIIGGTMIKIISIG